jgi:hypothetical protein
MSWRGTGGFSIAFGEIAMQRRAFWGVVGLAAVVVSAPARAEIYQWEYIDPLNPSQGKRQSTTLAPDGAGVDAAGCESFCPRWQRRVAARRRFCGRLRPVELTDNAFAGDTQAS